MRIETPLANVQMVAHESTITGNGLNMATLSEVTTIGQDHADSIRSVAESACFMCGSEGAVVYEDLSDRAFDAPGSWNLRKCRNPQCGLWWLDPMPAQDDMWKAYRSYYTHPEPEPLHDKPDIFRQVFRAYIANVKASYLERRYGYNLTEKHWCHRPAGWLAYLLPWRRAEWDMSVMFLQHRSGGKLLELGCGGGDLLGSLSACGWEAEGVDVDPQAIKNAKLKGLNVRLGQIEEMEYPANSFDAVIMVHVIEHIHDPRRLLQECHRVLKPGGQLSLVTPNAASFLHKVFKRSWFPLEPPRHLHIFTLDAIKKLLEESGFENAHAFTTIRDADGLVAASRSIRRTGRFTMRSAQPRWVRVFARMVQMYERVLMTVDRSIGEELTGVARK